MSTRRAEAFPVSAHAFHVLLALERGPLHGYAIMKEVLVTSGTSVGPGAVYGALQRLEAAGLVREGAQREPERGSHPRQEYNITASGVAALRAEARRFVGLARLATERNLVVEEGTS